MTNTGAASAGPMYPVAGVIAIWQQFDASQQLIDPMNVNGVDQGQFSSERSL